MKRMMFVGCVMVAGLLGGCESTQTVGDKDCTAAKCTDGQACTAEQMAECKERGSCDKDGAKCATKAACPGCKDGKVCAKCAAKKAQACADCTDGKACAKCMG